MATKLSAVLSAVPADLHRIFTCPGRRHHGARSMCVYSASPEAGSKKYSLSGLTDSFSGSPTVTGTSPGSRTVNRARSSGISSASRWAARSFASRRRS